MSALRILPKGLFATDLDGTLLSSGSGFHGRDIRALEALGRMNVIRIIATGRSPFSFSRMIGERVLPLDYLVLSSGAGIVDYVTGEYLRIFTMGRELTSRAVSHLLGSGLDFCVQDRIPNNHAFTYCYQTGSNPDLERRIDLYQGHCSQMGECWETEASTQIVVIVPPGKSGGIPEELKAELGPEYSVLRATSPLDGRSLWVEIFPAGVSKSRGVEWIAGMHGLTGEDSAAVGNDYNDHDLLEWAGSGFVVEDSPRHLKTSFTEVPAVGMGGVAEAARLWLVRKGHISGDDTWPL